MTPPRQPAPAGTWCAIPVYNNAGTAAAVARAARERVDRVVVVDDGSTDGDLRAALADSDIVVLRHPARRGKGAALRTALAHVVAQGGHWMLSLDGDGQHLPADIPRFFPAMEAQPEALVVGSRDLHRENVPRASRFGRRFSNFWVFLETGRSLPDTQSGFRAYPVACLSRQPPAGDHFDFEIEALVRHAWAGLPLVSVPVGAYYPPAAERVSHFDKRRDNLRLSLLHARLLTLRLAQPFSLLLGKTRATSPLRPRRRGNRLGFWFFAVATRLTGLRGAYGLLYFVCLYYLLFDREAVAAARAYLGRRFPERSSVRLFLDAYRLFVSQGRCLIDRYAALGGMPFHFEFHGRERLEGTSGQGLILLLAHLGNWQIALGTLRNLGRPVCLLMRPEDSPAVADYLRVSSSGPELRIVNPESPFGGVIELVRYLSEGWIVCLMGDRGYRYQAAPVRFLGGTAHFPVGAFRIAAAAGCPVLGLFVWRTGHRRYDLEVPLVCRPEYRGGSDRAEQLRGWAQEFAAAMEGFAEAHPFQVFLFQDVWTEARPLDDHERPSQREEHPRRIDAEYQGLAGGKAS